MRPEGTRVWRKNGRATRKRFPTGRRTSHLTKTQAKRADWKVRLTDLVKDAS